MKHDNAIQSKTVIVISFCKPKDSGTAKLEGYVALLMACHSDIFNTDHLVIKSRNTITDSKTTLNLQTHWIKCSQIIKNV